MIQRMHTESVHFGGFAVSPRVKEQLTSDFFTGIKPTNAKIPIGTFRCRTCGFLESYAREEFAEKW